MAFYNAPFDAQTVNERIEGEGKYVFPDGNIYIGRFRDGQIDGHGTIYFVNGGKLDAEWSKGVALKETLTFKDGLEYSEHNWDYCTETDRRFYFERVNGFLPGEAQLSNEPSSAKTIPIMTDDFGYCYYAHGDKKIHNFDGEAIRDPTEKELHYFKTVYAL